MNVGDNFTYGMLGLAVLGLAAWCATQLFSAEARERRRRTRSHRRIMSRARRPMVKFSVKTK